MIQDLVHNLCESLVKNIGGVAGIGKKTPPTPITYLTQWKIVGNSEVHGVGNLTSWKVSGNSIVDNNTILSCGDLGQDGKYHVKISNGATIFDIPLDAPLRKVNDVADSIEFPSGTEGKALVTRNLIDIGNLATLNTWSALSTGVTGKVRWRATDYAAQLKPASKFDAIPNILCSIYPAINSSTTYDWRTDNKGINISVAGNILIIDEDYSTSNDYNNFIEHLNGVELISELATPTTELVDVSPFPVSATDTYTSANVVPYSAFEHTENKEIWSCGEYNATDGKYHILVQPQGGSIADIALDAPLRKVNDVADTIEFPSDTEGKALVTRCLGTTTFKKLATLTKWNHYAYPEQYVFYNNGIPEMKYASSVYALIPGYTQYSNTSTSADIAILDMPDKYYSFGYRDDQKYTRFYIKDYDYSDVESFIQAKGNIEIIYELATPTTELIDAPQIEEAESYSMVISQGGKAVEWSGFETE